MDQENPNNYFQYARSSSRKQFFNKYAAREYQQNNSVRQQQQDLARQYQQDIARQYQQNADRQYQQQNVVVRQYQQNVPRQYQQNMPRKYSQNVYVKPVQAINYTTSFAKNQPVQQRVQSKNNNQVLKRQEPLIQKQRYSKYDKKTQNNYKYNLFSSLDENWNRCCQVQQCGQFPQNACVSGQANTDYWNKD